MVALIFTPPASFSMKWLRANARSRELPSGLLLDAILHRLPIPPRQLNPNLFELERIISKCLERIRGALSVRQGTGRDLRHLQRGFLCRQHSVLPPAPEPARSFVRNKSFLATLAAILLLSSFAAIFFTLNSRNILPHLFTRSPPGAIHRRLPLANLSGDPEREFFAERSYRRTHHASLAKAPASASSRASPSCSSSTLHSP